MEVHSDETRGYVHKLQLGKIQLDIRKSFFHCKVGKYRSRLRKKAVECPCLEIVKTQLDTALSNLLSPDMLRVGGRTV